MVAKSFKAALVLITLFFLNPSFAQQKTDVSAPGFKLFFEKVYLHTDRTYYASGDDIWFKAYLVNAQNNYTINTSNNLYVELINSNNEIAQKEVVRLDNGTGVGDFYLSDSIKGGTYKIRAYTNWMRNFDSKFVFEKEIQVASLFEKKNNTASISNGGKLANAVSSTKYKIQFLPQGGAMVADVLTIVAFKAEDIAGKGIDIKGSIVSDKGDTVVRFKTTFSGMGSFAFKPVAGVNYKAAVQFKNNTFITTELPEIYATGYVMNLNNDDTANVAISVTTNAATVAKFPSAELAVIARHAGKIYYKQMMTLKDGKADFTLSKKDFPEGIASVTLYDQDQRPGCESLIYVDKNDPIDIAVTTNKMTYGPKEKVTVNITATNAQNQPVKTAFSMAVVDDDIVKQTNANIQCYLLLESEIKGKIENPGTYFDKNNGQRFQQLELLLRTQGWRDFLWRRLLDTSIKISFLPEPGITVSGNVRQAFANKPVPGMNITLFAPAAKGDKIYMTKTNELGKYYLDGLPLYGTQTVKVTSKNGKGSKGGMLTVDDLFNNPLAVNPNYPYISDTSMALKRYTIEAANRFQSAKNNNWYNVLQNVTVTAKKNRTFTTRDGIPLMRSGEPDYDFTITAADYKENYLQDFLVRKVPGAQYNMDKEGVTFTSNGRQISPRFVVDNREDVFERIDYYTIPMDQIKAVTVSHLIGPPTFSRSESANGRINLGTNINDIYVIFLSLKPGAFNRDISSATTELTGYYEARQFYTPNYAAQSEAKQDMRTTIHWQPYITTDNNGKASVSFYNADPKTNIRIDIQGLTDKGKPVVAEAKYQVK